MFVVLLGVSVYLACYATYKLFIYPYYLCEFLDMPGPPNTPGWRGWIMGNIPEILDSPPVQPLMNWREKYGDFVRFRFFFNEPRVSVSDPVAIRRVLIDNADNYRRPIHVDKILKLVLGEGLLTVWGDTHKHQHAQAMPAFTSASIRQLLPTIQKHSAELASLWRAELEALPHPSSDANRTWALIDVHKSLMLLTFDIICDVGFSVETNSMKRHREELQSLMRVDSVDSGEVNWYETLEIIIGSTGLDIRNLLPFWMQKHLVKRAATAEFLQQREKLYSFVDDIIREKRANLEKTDQKPKADLMSFLIAGDGGPDGLTDYELRSNVITFILAGHETTAVSLAWCLYSLAKEPAVQSKLRDEIRVALSKRPGERLSYTEIEDMEYLNCVVKEVLRLYPAAPLVPRESISADVLGGYHIPPGTTVLLAPGVTHRTGDWEQPMKFIPDRWINWSGPSGIKRLSYMPFSSGPKMCIGHRLATLEMKCALIDAINKYEFKLPPDHEVKEILRITLRPEPDMTLLVSEFL